MFLLSFSLKQQNICHFSTHSKNGKEVFLKLKKGNFQRRHIQNSYINTLEGRVIISALVAGVPIPEPFIWALSSSSSMRFPAFSEIEKGELSKEAYTEQLYQYIRRQITAMKEKDVEQNCSMTSNENTQVVNCSYFPKSESIYSQNFW